MGTEPRPLRADAERNRHRILDAAAAVFAREGLGAGVDVVAREAGVGVGTIYRRFPTKEALLEAVIADRIERVEATLVTAADREDPWDAFAAAAEALAENVARDVGFFQVMQEAKARMPDIADHARRCMVGAVSPVLERAQRAGAVRGDLVPIDVLSLCNVAARLPRWRLEREPELWRRYLAVVLDGTRADAAHPLPHPPPRADDGDAQSGDSTTSAA
jgi:AcrR family transcriptional regulator